MSCRKRVIGLVGGRADPYKSHALAVEDDEEFRRKTRFVVKLGRALHACGATSQRVERHLGNVTAMLGIHGSFLLTPTTFTCAFWQDDELDQFIHIERVQPSDNDLGRLWEIDRLVEDMAVGSTGFEQGMDALDRVMKAPPNHPVWVSAMAWALSGGAFSALLSPSWPDCLSAAVLALLLFALDRMLSNDSRWNLLLTILAPFVSGLLAAGFSAAGLAINVPFVVLSSIIVFVPGLALTVALTEISSRDLISGTSRLVDALMMLLKLFFGALGGVAVAALVFSGKWQPFPMDWPPMVAWKAWPSVFGLSVGLAVVFNIPFRKLPWGLTSAALAFFAASKGEAWFGMHAGMFLGALAVGLYSNLFSRLTKAPGSILMTQGIVLLVPGSKVYMILNHWVSGQEILPGSESATQALMAFVALVAGLLVAAALLPTRKSL